MRRRGRIEAVSAFRANASCAEIVKNRQHARSDTTRRPAGGCLVNRTPRGINNRFSSGAVGASITPSKRNTCFYGLGAVIFLCFFCFVRLRLGGTWTVFRSFAGKTWRQGRAGPMAGWRLKSQLAPPYGNQKKRKNQKNAGPDARCTCRLRQPKLNPRKSRRRHDFPHLLRHRNRGATPVTGGPPPECPKRATPRDPFRPRGQRLFSSRAEEQRGPAVDSKPVDQITVAGTARRGAPFAGDGRACYPAQFQSAAQHQFSIPWGPVTFARSATPHFPKDRRKRVWISTFARNPAKRSRRPELGREDLGTPIERPRAADRLSIARR